MNKNVTIVLILCIYFKTSYSQCDDNKCYQNYKNLIKNDKDDIQKVFDQILEKYGDVDGDLRNLLNKLNETTLRADQNLYELEKVNNDIQNTNDQTNSTLPTLLEDVKIVEGRVNNINGTDRKWLDELNDANNTANLNVSPVATLNDVKASEDEIEKWRNFLEKFDKANYAKDIMNIPHSVSDDLNLLENLLNEEHDTKCFDKFHEDLKNLFAQLANLVNFDGFVKELTDLKKRADRNQDKSNDILDETNKLLEEENKLKNTLDLANETLQLADDIEELKNHLDKLLEGSENLFDERLKELQKAHEKEVEALYKKYKTDEFEVLLDELEDIKKQIDEMTGGGNVNIADVGREIEGYMDDIDYYTCILEDCHYRRPADAVTTFNCVRRAPDAQ